VSLSDHSPHEDCDEEQAFVRKSGRRCLSSIELVGMSVIGTSATFKRRGSMSEVHPEADISRIADPAALMSTQPKSQTAA
jgi:hypothetical protein